MVPPMPKGAAHIWAWFCELSETRGSSGMGPARITRHDIHAWERDEGHRLDPWERRALIQLDGAWMRSRTASAG